MSKILKFNASVKDLVSQRKSVRTYDETREISDEIIKDLNEYIENLKGPFQPKVRFKIIKTKESIDRKNLGTYGVVKGTDTYIGAVVEKGYMDLENLGYAMESLILYATSLGLGTCWLGGTFNKSSFSKAMEVKDNEIFTIISPIGYESSKTRIVDKLFRKGNGDRRREWGELFFLKDFYTPLDKDNNAYDIIEALENLRLAPSAMNKQPWRIVLEGKKVHFFKVGKQNPRVMDNKINLNRVDMGIALAHFHLTCKEMGIEGEFTREILKIDGVPQNVEYLITWTRK